MGIPFDLWLFTVKHLGQTVDMSKMIYDSLPEERKESIKSEYEHYRLSNH